VVCTDKTGTLTHGKMTAEMFDCMQGSTIIPEHRPDSPAHRSILTALALTADAKSSKVSADDKTVTYFGSATERTALSDVYKRQVFCGGFGVCEGRAVA